MLNIALQISVYILIAIILGYIFGWLITKLHLEEIYHKKMQAILLQAKEPSKEVSELKERLFQLQRENKRVESEKERVSSLYHGQKYVLDEHNDVLDDFQKQLLSKDATIEELTRKLKLLESRELKLNTKHEEEIDAFVLERVEITKKYKALIEKYERLTKSKSENSSWF